MPKGVDRQSPTPFTASATRISLEFFPPRNGDIASINTVVGRLKAANPLFCSCTYGAGGSTRDGTRQTVAHLFELGLDAAPHLSIGTDSEATIHGLLDEYRALGVRRIVALRGDVPSGVGRARYIHNAETLVRWIRAHSGDHFDIEVAAYPETHPDARSPGEDLEFFRRKVEAGATGAITQYFYNVQAWENFAERASRVGVSVPIVPGIMPITNLEGIVRFSESCGADLPRWIRKHLEALRDDEAGLKAFGIDVVTRLCEDLLAAGAPGLHFYTLNRWGATAAICRNLGLLSPS
ncbi:MAG: methylenetetrahydrofolate reductase [Pseudomonadales bacterium]